jgi:transposase
MDKRIKYSFRQKLSTVRSITAGRESCLSAARKIGSKENTVQRWLRLYKQHGSKGLKLRNGSYTGDFKLRVVRYMMKNKLSLIRTAVLFKIPQDSAVGRWLKVYQRLGAAGLLKETRGRKKSLMNKKTKKKIEGTSTADPAAEKVATLQQEVEYLRAENAFLKKLGALIQQEKATKAQNRRQKPSKN